MDFEKIFTLGLALYGAVLSTLLGIRELTKERRQVLIFLEYSEFRDGYSIIITNVGHRPITLLGVFMDCGGEWVPQNAIIESDNDPFPATLTDGQHLTLPLYEGVSAAIAQVKEDIKIVVYDTENRKYTKFKKLSYNEKIGIRSPRGKQYPK